MSLVVALPHRPANFFATPRADGGAMMLLARLVVRRSFGDGARTTWSRATKSRRRRRGARERHPPARNIIQHHRRSAALAVGSRTLFVLSVRGGDGFLLGHAPRSGCSSGRAPLAAAAPARGRRRTRSSVFRFCAFLYISKVVLIFLDGLLHSCLCGGTADSCLSAVVVMRDGCGGGA